MSMKIRSKTPTDELPTDERLDDLIRLKESLYLQKSVGCSSVGHYSGFQLRGIIHYVSTR